MIPAAAGQVLPLLAFAEAKRYPKIPPDLDTEIAWIVAAVLIAVVVWAWSRAPWLRRLLFVAEDPRTYAIFRVMLASFTFACFWNLEPYWRFLWSDEGMFTLTEARGRLGRSSLSGWTTEDGFLGPWAVAKFFWTKPSLWFLKGSPAYVYGTMWVFFGLLFAYAIGFRTRVTGVLCWLMLISIYNRNSFYLEGTDTVYRVLWFYAIIARTDAAWSVDNVIRVARERRRQVQLFGAEAQRGLGARLGVDLGLLGDHALSIAWASLWAWLIVTQLDMHFDAPYALLGLALFSALGHSWWAARRARAAGPCEVQRYRGVPRWPRVLIMIQYGLLYCNTGAVKTGVVWMKGDALYYALNLDHFYRWDGFTQVFSELFAMNMFHLATWVTHFWEIGFPLLLVGMWLTFRASQAQTPWALEARARLRHKLGSWLLLVAWLLLGYVMVKSLPYLFPLDKKDAQTMPPFIVQTFSWVWFGGLPLLGALLFGLHRWAPTVPGWKLRRLSMPPVTIDGAFLRRWFLGRRVWLSLGLIFHGFLIAFMNIGMFPFIMIGGYLAFFSAREELPVLRWLYLKLPGSDPQGRIAAALAPHENARGLDALDLNKRGGAFIDDRWLLVFAGAVLGLAMARGQAPAFWGELGTLPALGFAMVAVLGLVAYRWAHGLTLAAAATFCSLVSYGIASSFESFEMTEGPFKESLGRGMHAILGWLLVVALVYAWRRRTRAPEGHAIYGGTASRALVTCFCLWHMLAVSAVLAPKYPIWSTWQSQSRRVFGGWLRGTKTNQSWKMFAPNPPRANSFSRTVLVDANDQFWDLNNNSYYNRPSVFWANDRMRKMQRRLIGKGKWYVRYWVNYQCREWQLGGEEKPREVQVYKYVTRIPKPHTLAKKKGIGWDPRKTKVTLHFVQKHNCGDQGALTPEMKERRGLPLDEADLRRIEKAEKKATREAKTRREAWARRRDYGGEGPALKGSFAEKGESAAPRGRAAPAKEKPANSPAKPAKSP